MFTFDSDYLKEKILTLESCVLLSSKMHSKYPRVFFTRDLNNDKECEIMVIEVFKKESIDMARKKKKAKTLLVTTTPLASFDYFVSSGMDCEYVVMDQERILEISQDNEKEEYNKMEQLSSNESVTAVNNGILNFLETKGEPTAYHALADYRNIRGIMLLKPNDLLVSAIFGSKSKQRRFDNFSSWDNLNSNFYEDLQFQSGRNSQKIKKNESYRKKVQMKFNKVGSICPFAFSNLREDFLAFNESPLQSSTILRNIQDFTVKSQEYHEQPSLTLLSLQSYGHLQRRYKLKKALKKIFDSKKYFNRRSRESIVNNLGIFPCSHSADLFIKPNSSRHIFKDEESGESNGSFIIETTAKSCKVFSNEDGIIRVREVIARRCKHGNGVKRNFTFKKEEFDSSDDFDSDDFI